MSHHHQIAPPITREISVCAEAPQILRMVYQNYRGEVAERRVLPHRIWFGATDYHPQLQWLMDAFDLDRNEARAFALSNIKQFVQGA